MPTVLQYNDSGKGVFNMKKIYESPEAEVISFTAMEQLASLNPVNPLDISLADPGFSFSAIDRTL